MDRDGRELNRVAYPPQQAEHADRGRQAEQVRDPRGHPRARGAVHQDGEGDQEDVAQHAAAAGQVAGAEGTAPGVQDHHERDDPIRGDGDTLLGVDPQAATFRGRVLLARA